MSRSAVTLITSVRALGRVARRATDAMRLYRHAWVTEHGRQWEHPDAELSEEDLEALDMRALGRTLEEIDEL